MAKFHKELSSLQTSRCSTCLENFPGVKMKSNSSECVRCHLDSHIPKLYSSANNMHPGVVPPHLQVSLNGILYQLVCPSQTFCMWQYLHDHCFYALNFTGIDTGGGDADLSHHANDVCLPPSYLWDQYACSGHVINLPLDVISSLPRSSSQLDIIVVRKETSNQSHHDFRVRRAVVNQALQWLFTHNIYYHANHIHFNQEALAHLPQGWVSHQHPVCCA